MSLPFLLEIGTEEIPDWMIKGALNSLFSLVAVIPGDGHISGQRYTSRGVGVVDRDHIPGETAEHRWKPLSESRRNRPQKRQC